MNESVTDPVLRSFRQPVTIRLRAKLDEKCAVIDAQAGTIAKQGRELSRLRKELAAQAALLEQTRAALALAEAFLTGGDADTETID